MKVYVRIDDYSVGRIYTDIEFYSNDTVEVPRYVTPENKDWMQFATDPDFNDVETFQQLNDNNVKFVEEFYRCELKEILTVLDNFKPREIVPWEL